MIVEFDNVSCVLGDRKIISSLSLKIKKEEKICIIGPSGCGKTSLLNLISGNIQPSEGSVIRNFKNLSCVFQEDRLLPWRTAAENISIVNPAASKDQLKEMISLVELSGFERHLPRQLSGGMRQRVSIARGFFYPAELLLMDEPLKSLDYSLRINLLYSILKLADNERRTLVYVTHEIDEALIIADRIIVLGKNPAAIKNEIILPEAQAERSLQSSKLISARNIIINALNNRAVYQGP